MILRSTGGSSSHSRVGNSIGGLSKDSVEESDIIGDNSSCEMVAEIIATFNNSVNIFVCVGDNNLERTKEFSSTQLEVFDELFETDLNGCRFICTISFRDVVFIGKRFASEEKFGSRYFQTFINVFLNSFVVPGDNRANSQIGKLTFL